MPVDVVELSTQDADVGCSAINDTFASECAPVAFRVARTGFRLDMRSASIAHIGADTVEITAKCVATAQPLASFHVATLLSGETRFVAGEEDVRAQRGDVVRYPSEAILRAEWQHLDVAFVRIPLEAIESTAHVDGADSNAIVRFHSIVPVSPSALRHWRLTASFVHRALAVGGPTVDSALWQSELIGMVAAAALAVFPNSTMTAHYERQSSPALPAPVRRAVAYIDTHLHEPIRVTDVAGAARVTPRALQHAFRNRYGVTPMDYVRRARLDAVHAELSSADPTRGATVADIAARWGLAGSSDFAARYREIYGVSPRHTLWS